MKWCKGICGREKPLEAFDREPRVSDGRTSRCHVCRRYESRTRKRKRYAKDHAWRETVKARNRAKYQRFRPAFLARQWARDEAKRQEAA